MAGSVGLLGLYYAFISARSPHVAVRSPNYFSLSGENSVNYLVSYLLALLPRFWLETSTLSDAKSGCEAKCQRLNGRAKAYIVKRYRWYCAHFWRLTPEVLLTTMSRHHLGSVDCWLCQPNHQIFGGDPADYPRLRVESAWVTSS